MENMAVVEWNWDEFKREITKRFTDFNAERRAREQMQELRQTKGVKEYIADFQRVNRIVKTMDEQSRKLAFLEGLRRDL